MLSRSLKRYATIPWRPCLTYASRRNLVSLAIESSCDDASVAVAKILPSGRLAVHFHETITANTDEFRGIHPLAALRSHQASLGPLVQRALKASPRPDLIAATRGPGMRSNLSVGLDTAKGLSLGLNVPFIGVHHMQAHALTPRLVAALEGSKSCEFPFLTVLASGGHTMLIDSSALTEHTILAETQDIALGDCLDKSARAILPAESFKTPYGRALEDFAFPNGREDYNYAPPSRRQEELEKRKTNFNWALGPPLAESKGGQKSSKRMVFSFSGLLSSVQRFMLYEVNKDGSHTLQTREAISIDERREMAREVLRVAFEHLASRILLHLSASNSPLVRTIVVSGGVASNQYLRHVLRAILDIRGYSHIELAFPPVKLCTDNALMIAWAAFEMWHAGFRSRLDIEPIRKWSMDHTAEDGGILRVGGWINESAVDRLSIQHASS